LSASLCVVPSANDDDRATPEYALVGFADVTSQGVMPPYFPPEVRQRYAGKTLTVAYDVFLAPDGSVTKVQVVTSVPELDKTMTSHLMSLKYRPPNRYVRFPVKLSLPLAPAGYQPPPPHPLWGARVSGEYPRLPDEVKKRNVGKQLVGLYIVSIERDGHVSAVETKVPIPGAEM